MPQVKNERINNLLSWIRLLIPMAIAAIGWYVGQTVSSINADISELKNDFTALNSDYIAFKSKTQNELDNRTREIYNHVSNGEFDTRMGLFSDRLDRLENKNDRDRE